MGPVVWEGGFKRRGASEMRCCRSWCRRTLGSRTFGNMAVGVMTTILSFQDALEVTGNGRRHLLLGNGFSRACRNDLFAYDALFEKAKEQLSPTILGAFDALDTTDFERTMRALKQAQVLVKTYAPDNHGLADSFHDDVESLRQILAKVIASNHPERMDEIPDERFRSCRIFLQHFKNTYTLNYDILLYWALMKDDVDELHLDSDDGFRHSDDGPVDYVVWDFNDSGRQNIFYMHGALHLFDGGHEVQKYTWSNTGIALVDQILDALKSDRYPIYVSEGTSQSKLERIMHSGYLIRGYRSLSQIGGSLFIFGHSLQANDGHVLRCIEESKVNKVFVSIFGDPNTPDNQRIINRAESFSANRSNPQSLSVLFYDAESANVWG